MLKDQYILRFLASELPPGLHHKPIADLTTPGDPHIHFTAFKNSIFVQKWALVKLLG